MTQLQPKYYAFFDVDGTIIDIKSMFSFLKYFYMAESKLLGAIKFNFFIFNTLLLEKFGVSREYLNKRYYKKFKNYPVKMVEAVGQNWFEQEIKANSKLFIKNTLHEIEKHKFDGAEVVLVSGSFSACLKPISDYLNINLTLATLLETKNGKLTGNILQQTIGKGKVEVIKKFLRIKKYSCLQQCYAYGDHESDIEMLNIVGNPRIIEGDKNTELYAKKNGWEILKK